MRNLEELVKSLEYNGVLRTPSIRNALLKIDRIDFVNPDHKEYAYEDRALVLMESQTISQPYTVVFMLELLQTKKGDKVLDIGSGSGWTTALLSEIVGEKGYVHAMERIAALKEFGENNFLKTGNKNASFILGNGADGLPDHAPFDKILVSASTKRMPKKVFKQLKQGGTMIIPFSEPYNSIKSITKINDDEYEEKVFPGFVFVPFID